MALVVLLVLRIDLWCGSLSDNALRSRDAHYHSRLASGAHSEREKIQILLDEIRNPYSAKQLLKSSFRVPLCTAP
jgi:hypothetical protein